MSVTQQNTAPFNPTNSANVNGALYFHASDPINGPQLWTSDGTGTGTHIVDVVGSGSPFDITAGPGAGALIGLHTAALAGGGFAVAFTAQSDSPGDSTNNIYAEVFNANGQQVGGMIEVNPPNALTIPEARSPRCPMAISP